VRAELLPMQVPERRLIAGNRPAEGAEGRGQDLDAAQLVVHAIERAIEFVCHSLKCSLGRHRPTCSTLNLSWFVSDLEIGGIVTLSHGKD